MSSTLDRSKTLFKGKGNTLIRNKNATCDNGKERDLNTHSQKKLNTMKCRKLIREAKDFKENPMVTRINDNELNFLE